MLHSQASLTDHAFDIMAQAFGLTEAEIGIIRLMMDGKNPTEIAEAEALRLETEYDQDRIKALIANDGWA